jgi:hypothetical protein
VQRGEEESDNNIGAAMALLVLTYTPTERINELEFDYL